MTWQQIPFLRLLFPLLLGILFYSETELAIYGGWQLGLMLCVFSVLIFTKDKQKQSIRQTRFWGMGLMFILFLFGFFISSHQDIRNDKNYFGRHLETEPSFIARIESPPKLHAKTVKTTLSILATKNKEQQFVASKGKLIAYFHLDSLSSQLNYGDEILLNGKIKAIEGPKNPAAFDFRTYYKAKQLYYQVYLGQQQWKLCQSDQGNVWSQLIYAARKRLLRIFKEHLNSPNEYAVASALILGSKDALSNDLRNAYADTGAMHVLAVSGLHVGILAGILSFLLGLVRSKNKYWESSKVLLVLAILWLFAVLTGASASVLRACTMFSFVLAGQAFHRKINVYNSLAASAFFLLCINPFMLYDVGFQLSYLALIGIVYLYPKIYRSWYIENRLGDWLWSGISISLAAQFITAPISLYYFHQFPVFFWLSGVIVTAAAGLILSIGLGLLLLNSVPFLGLGLGYLLYTSIWVMNSLIFSIQQLPGAVWEGFWLEYWQMCLWYVVLASFVWFLIKKELKWAFIPLTACLVLFMDHSTLVFQQQQQQEWCVFNSNKNTIISYIDGTEAYTIANQATIGSPQLSFSQQNYLWSKGIQNNQVISLLDSIQKDRIYYNNKKGQIQQQRFLLYSEIENQLNTHELLAVDYVLIHGNPKLKSVKDIEHLCTFKTLIFDRSNSPWKIKKWTEECTTLGIDFIDIQKGAWVNVLKAN